MIHQQMERGELSTEPENELGKLGEETKQLVSSRRGTDAAPSIKARAHTDGFASDDFFGGDEEEEEEEEEDSEQSEASDC